jgi:hypothetical protein
MAQTAIISAAIATATLESNARNRKDKGRCCRAFLAVLYSRQPLDRLVLLPSLTDILGDVC